MPAVTEDESADLFARAHQLSCRVTANATSVLPGKVRGRELAERVQALCPEVRVLFMSGYTENSIVHHGRLDDGVHLVGKPFKREQLARKVAEVLGSVAAAKEAANVVPLRLLRDASS